MEVWNSWMHETPDKEPDLSKVNLDKAYLGGANLSSANLYLTNLGGAYLGGAFLGNASLNGTSLGGAYLGGAYLGGATLSGTNLVRADLRAANLGGAFLVDADLCAANLGGAKLASTLLGLDLSTALGLAKVVHRSASTIGIDTLEKTAEGLTKNRSQQGEVEHFLRGAGVSEIYIESFRSQIGQPIEFYSCFISYSHDDKAFARRIYAQLQDRGIRCWLDEHAMVPGDDIMDAVDHGIRLSDRILLCCSQPALKDSWWVDDEIEKTLEKERELSGREGKKVRVLIPLNLDGFMFGKGWQSGYKATLKRRLAADFTGWEKDNDKFEAQFERVVQALRPRSDDE